MHLSLNGSNHSCEKVGLVADHCDNVKCHEVKSHEPAIVRGGSKTFLLMVYVYMYNMHVR